MKPDEIVGYNRSSGGFFFTLVCSLIFCLWILTLLSYREGICVFQSQTHTNLIYRLLYNPKSQCVNIHWQHNYPLGLSTQVDITTLFSPCWLMLRGSHIIVIKMIIDARWTLNWTMAVSIIFLLSNNSELWCLFAFIPTEM